MSRLPSRNLGLWLGIVLPGLAAFVLLQYATRPLGLGVSHDSVFYLSAAQNFMGGDGLSWPAGGGELKPLTHFPPLYPVILGLIKGLAGGLRPATRYLASILYAGNIILISSSIYLLSSSTRVAVVGGAVALVSPVLLDIHLDTMSEPLFIFFALLSLIFLGFFFREYRTGTLVGSAAFASMAFLTRYVGTSLVLSGMVSIWLFSQRSAQDRWRNALLFGGIAVAPNLFWYFRNYQLTGSLTNRILGFHLPTREHLHQAVDTISSWVIPDLSSGYVQLFVTLLVVMGGGALGVYFWRRTKSQTREDHPWEFLFFGNLVLFCASYALLLLTSITFFDASTPLSNRILSPIYFSTLILASAALTFLFRRIPLFSTPIAIGTVLLVIAFALQSRSVATENRTAGRGFNSRMWRESETMMEVRDFDPQAVIYSNEAFPIWYLAEIPAYWIPEKLDPVKAQARLDYQSDIELMRRRLKTKGSALVLFHPDALRSGMPTYEEITFGLKSVYQAEDGEIFVGGTTE